jgi:hypothetical protein
LIQEQEKNELMFPASPAGRPVCRQAGSPNLELMLMNGEGKKKRIKKKYLRFPLLCRING